MAALSTIGVIFGYGVGASASAVTSWTKIDECVSISSVSATKEQLDCTPLESSTKKYVGGHADTGGSLTTTFNFSDTFETAWGTLEEAYASKSSTESMFFCAYHPNRAKMNIYEVEPGHLPAPEYSVGAVLQAEIENVLVDLPDPITAKKPV